MAKRPAALERQPAHVSFDAMKKAIPKLDRRITELKSLDVQTMQSGSDAQLMALTQKMDGLLIDLFGNQSHEYFQYHPQIELRVTPLFVGHDDIHKTRYYVSERIQHAATMLETIKENFTESLEDAGISGTSVKAIKAYEGLELHPAIAQVASELFRDGYYANAVEDAVKALNAMVRGKSGINEDGSKLMHKSFGSNKPKIPTLQFNPLQDDSDWSEQEGFMHLFIGAVMALRNPRAHKIIKDDPEIALEFIALVSLLAKFADKATATNIVCLQS